MKRPRLITGLDIGSSKAAAVTAEAERGGFLNILAHESRRSKGVLRGAVADLGETVDVVSRVLSALRGRVGGGTLGDIYVNINGLSVKGERSRGMVPLSIRGREVTPQDIARCVNVASTIRLPLDREIIHRLVLNFFIDDQKTAVRNPQGLYASRLTCETYVITADINHMQNIYKTLNSAGYDVKGLVFTGVADGESFLAAGGNSGCVMLLDMGAQLTTVSIHSQGALSDLEVIPQGAQDIRKALKEDAAFSNILARIKSRREESSLAGLEVDSAVAAGGLIYADGIIETLEEALSCPVRTGVARNIKGEISSLDNMRLATAIGVVRYAASRLEKKARKEKNIIEFVSSRVVDIFNNYF